MMGIEMYGGFLLEKPGISQCMNIFDADIYVYIRCFCYVMYVMIWIAMYGLSCISIDNSYTSGVT